MQVPWVANPGAQVWRGVFTRRGAALGKVAAVTRVTGSSVSLGILGIPRVGKVLAEKGRGGRLLTVCQAPVSILHSRHLNLTKAQRPCEVMKNRWKRLRVVLTGRPGSA